MAPISSQGVHAPCTWTAALTVPHFPHAQLIDGRSSSSAITSWSPYYSSPASVSSTSSASSPASSDPVCATCPQYDPTKAHPTGANPTPFNISVTRADPTSPTPFLAKTYELVDDPDTDPVVSWSNEGTSFVVWSPPDLCQRLLPRYFKHSNFSSFIRQLNTYGFRKIAADQWEFAHVDFRRGQPHLLGGIYRKRPSALSRPPMPWFDVDYSCSSSTITSSSCSSVASGMELQKESLKKDKNLIMRELMSLQEKVRSTTEDLHTMWERLQMAETCQYHMVSFIIKAIHNPSFLAQFQQESSVAGAGSVATDSFLPKKRRLRDVDQPVLSKTDHGMPHPYKQNWVVSVNAKLREQLPAAPTHISDAAVDGGRPMFDKYYAADQMSQPAQHVDAGFYGTFNVADTCSTYGAVVNNPTYDAANPSGRTNYSSLETSTPPQQEVRYPLRQRWHGKAYGISPETLLET